MAGREDAEQFHAETSAQWRSWLERNHPRPDGVWLVSWKRPTGRPFVEYEDAVIEAIAFGWVDSSARSLDDERSALWFAPRRPRSAWAGTNKARVARLEAEGRMAEAGRRAVLQAKENGMWTVLDDAERLIVPDDLAEALAAHPGARDAWNAMTPSTRRAELTTIALAVRAETRARHIARIATERGGE